MLFSAWSLCALKNRLWRAREKKRGGKEKQPNFGFRESHWVRSRSSGKPLSGRGRFPRKTRFVTSARLSLLPKRERNNRMLPDSQGGRGREGRRERGRLKEGEIELPLPHIGNINPPYEKKKRRERWQFGFTWSDSIYLNISFTCLKKKKKDDCGVSLWWRHYRHPETQDAMKSY